jgi:hypothetical protein
MTPGSKKVLMFIRNRGDRPDYEVIRAVMMQLILEHAATTATPRAKEIDHDL